MDKFRNFTVPAGVWFCIGRCTQDGRLCLSPAVTVSLLGLNLDDFTLADKSLAGHIPKNTQILISPLNPKIRGGDATE